MAKCDLVEPRIGKRQLGGDGLAMGGVGHAGQNPDQGWQERTRMKHQCDFGPREYTLRP